MTKKNLQILAAGLALLSQPLYSQKVRLARVGLGMTETEVREALGEISTHYIGQPSNLSEVHYLVAETEAESFAFTFDRRSGGGVLAHAHSASRAAAIPGCRPGPFGEGPARSCHWADVEARRNPEGRHFLV